MRITSCSISNLKCPNTRKTISFGMNKRNLLSSVIYDRDINISIPNYPQKVADRIQKAPDAYNTRIDALYKQLDDIYNQDYHLVTAMQSSEKYEHLFRNIRYCNDPVTREIMVDKESGTYRIYEALDRLHDKTRFGRDTVDPDNCIMVVCKDDDVSKRFIDIVDFHVKTAGKLTDAYRAFNYDYTMLQANPDNNMLQESIGEALEKAEESYKKTGRETLLYVPEMERLVDPKRNTFENIECMKEIMNTCGDDYHTTIIFSAKNPEILDPGTMVSHRVGYRAALDDSITASDFKHFDEYISQYAPYKEWRYKTMDDYYAKTLPIAEQIEKLQKECKTKIEDLCHQTDDIIEKGKKNKQITKVTLIVAGILTAISLPIFIYKKIKSNNKKSDNKKVSAEVATNVVSRPYDMGKMTSFNMKRPDVFKEFNQLA